ncbi:ribonuclease P/MRP protein subunit POP5 [Strongylocentrotus purpuratus]|uniref:Ribonuclease P/MRP protein subunit POP5 n=1 Tax=Strongylocentrotus purpuratus TaxID=7668 RepID=A0A7M7RDN4_STRPU|nr:ribonuclease P/MRP protein subunit POP5 [Strongylocentrotus purpuratus]XP_787064.3 ribonuclease P/MRP protein subunit POP5 [Strongylocentrotus purpuratus]
MVRLKNRYVLGELILDDGRTATEAKLNTRVTQQAIHTVIKQLHGDFGIGAVTAGFVVKYVGLQTNTVLIKVRHRAIRYLTSSLPFVMSISKVPCCFLTLHVAGTMRACQKFLVKHDRRQLTILFKNSKTQTERNTVLDALKRCQAKETLWVEPKDDSFTDDDDSDEGR